MVIKVFSAFVFFSQPELSVVNSFQTLDSNIEWTHAAKKEKRNYAHPLTIQNLKELIEFNEFK